MTDNPMVVALLKELRDEALLSKTEAGIIIGKNRNEIAGIWNRHKEVIGSWPLIPKTVEQNRPCVFPIGVPGTEGFHLCDADRGKHRLFCKAHRRKKWQPPKCTAADSPTSSCVH